MAPIETTITSSSSGLRRLPHPPHPVGDVFRERRTRRTAIRHRHRLRLPVSRAPPTSRRRPKRRSCHLARLPPVGPPRASHRAALLQTPTPRRATPPHCRLPRRRPHGAQDPVNPDPVRRGGPRRLPPRRRAVPAHRHRRFVAPSRPGRPVFGGRSDVRACGARAAPSPAAPQVPSRSSTASLPAAALGTKRSATLSRLL